MTTLSLERLRADVAQLLHEAPADVRDDDDLIELGLDSIHMMRLAALWRAAGAQVEFGDLAATPTLAQWWALIHRAGAGGTP